MTIKVNVVSTEQTNGLMAIVIIGAILILGVSWATRIRLILCDCFGWEISLFIKGRMRVISAPFSCPSGSLEKSLHRTTIYTNFICDLLNRQTVVSEGGDFSLGTGGQN